MGNMIVFLYGEEQWSHEFPLPAREAIQRLKPHVKATALQALTSQRLIEKTSEEQVSLERAIPFVHNSFKPVFVGRIKKLGTGSRIEGIFRMNRATQVFMTFWFGFCVFFTLVDFSKVVDGQSSFPLGGIAMIFLGVLMVRLGRWFARNDQAWISSVVISAIEGDA